MNYQETLCRLALSRVKGIGPVRFKRITETIPDIELLYESDWKYLKQELGLPEYIIKDIQLKTHFNEMEKEIAYCLDHRIHILFQDQEDYPKHLKHCPDSPAVVFYQGNIEALSRPCIAVIGTRHNTEYGKKVCEELIQGLSQHNVTIVSGMAFGIDSIAHKQSLVHNIPTIGVMAHGLKHLYPSLHKNLVREMMLTGGIMTEYVSDDKVAKENFPERNRIVAGMSDATVIIETDIKGGSMITAELAYSYNKEVYCYPGKVTDVKSAGCNYLIRKLKAQLITGPQDLIEGLGWIKKTKPIPIQASLLLDLSESDLEIVRILQQQDELHIDDLLQKASISVSQLSNVLLNLEMMGHVKSLPGKKYRLV